MASKKEQEDLSSELLTTYRKLENERKLSANAKNASKKLRSHLKELHELLKSIRDEVHQLKEFVTDKPDVSPYSDRNSQRNVDFEYQNWTSSKNSDENFFTWQTWAKANKRQRVLDLKEQLRRQVTVGVSTTKVESGTHEGGTNTSGKEFQFNDSIEGQMVTIENLGNYLEQYHQKRLEQDVLITDELRRKRLEEINRMHEVSMENYLREKEKRKKKAAVLKEQQMLQLPIKPIFILPKEKHTASIFWIHGLGEDGQKWKNEVEKYAQFMPWVNFVFPTAREKYITILDTNKHAWFDLNDDFSVDDQMQRDTESACLEIILQAYNEMGKGIEPERMILVGFSQGGMVALHTAYLLMSQTLGGVVSMCALPPPFLPLSLIPSEKGRIPLLCCLGRRDPYLPPEIVDREIASLKKEGIQTEVAWYPSRHEVTEDALKFIFQWLHKQLPRNFTLKYKSQL